MTKSQHWVQLIQQLAPQFREDPRALLAVARMEGLSGGIGDGGHAFGPFQLNDAGGVLTGRAGDHRSFAESDAGVRWAMQRIAQVAGGLNGAQAVQAIVRRFERPANPDREVAGALHAYGIPGLSSAPARAGGGVPGLSSQPARPGAGIAGLSPQPAGPDPAVLRQKIALMLIQNLGGQQQAAPTLQSMGEPGPSIAPVLSLLSQLRGAQSR